MESMKLSSSDFLLGWSIIDRWPQLLCLRMPHFPQVVPRHGTPLTGNSALRTPYQPYQTFCGNAQQSKTFCPNLLPWGWAAVAA